MGIHAISLIGDGKFGEIWRASHLPGQISRQIKIAKGVTTHGFAININPDLSAYDRIIPCGISDATVTSLSKELGREISLSQVQPIVEKYILQALEKVCA